MKSFKLKKVLASLVVLLLVSACGNDGGSALPLPNGNTNNAMVPTTPNTNTNVNGAGSISVASFADFKAKVVAGNFVSYEQFVRQNNLNSSQNIGFYFSDCTSSNEEYLGGFFNVSNNSCDFGFYRFFSAGQVTRMDDGKSIQEVKELLTEIVNSQTGSLKMGPAQFQVNKGTTSYLIDLNYPLGLNPIGEYNSTSGNMKRFFGYQYMNNIW